MSEKHIKAVCAFAEILLNDQRTAEIDKLIKEIKTLEKGEQKK